MISLTDLKKHLRIPTALTAEDAYILELEASAVAVVERATGKYYGEADTRTEYVPGTGIERLWLAEIPDAITSVTERESDDLTDAGTLLVEDTDYVVRDSVLVRVSGVWAADSEYGVAYLTGYAEGIEPGDVRQRVRELVALWFTERSLSPERAEAEKAILQTLPQRWVIA